MGNEALPPLPISRGEMKRIVFWGCLKAGVITTLVCTPIVWMGFAFLTVLLQAFMER